MTDHADKTPSHLTLRLASDEWARLRQDASTAGMGISEYVRARLFQSTAMVRRRRNSHPIKDQGALGKVLAMLGQARLASNLNQLAKAAHAGNLQLTPETHLAIMEAYADIRLMKAHLLAALSTTDDELA